MKYVSTRLLAKCLLLQEVTEVAEAGESIVNFMNDAAFCRVLQVVMAMARQVRRLVDQLGQEELMGKVEYCARALFVTLYVFLLLASLLPFAGQSQFTRYFDNKIK